MVDCHLCDWRGPAHETNEVFTGKTNVYYCPECGAKLPHMGGV